MAEKATMKDLRFKRTHAALQDAMLQLVTELDPDKITVKSITDRAQINRKTFYLHYESIEALFDEHMNALLEKFFDEVEKTPEIPEDIDGHAQRFFLYLADQDEPTTRLICTRGRYDYGGKLYAAQMTRYALAGNPFSGLSDDEFELVCDYVRTTALRFFRSWVRGGRKIEKQRAAELLGQISMHGVDPFM